MSDLDLSILVLSCDKYSDAWEPFYFFLNKYWPDCPFPVYHVSETKNCNYKNAVNIQTGPGKAWAGMLAVGLEKIKTKYVLLVLEDYFLMRKVDNQRIGSIMNLIRQEDAGLFRLYPCPGPNTTFKNYKDFGLIKKGQLYSTSTQASIWNKKLLQEIIDPSENGWEYERNSPARAAKLIPNVFLSVYVQRGARKNSDLDYPFTYTCTAICSGKWTKEAMHMCEQEHLKIDTDYRKVESSFDFFKRIYYPRFPVFIRHFVDFFVSKTFGFKRELK